MKNQLTLKDLPRLDVKIKGPYSYDPSLIFIKNYGYEMDYDVKLSNGKNLQRDFVWTIDQKRALIESILKEISLPEFHVLFYTPETVQFGKKQTTFIRVIDGKQRLSTIQQFINNEFGIIWNGEHYFYDDFDSDVKRLVWNCNLNFKIVYEYDDSRLTDEQLINWFYMVNFTGTQQDIEHLEYLKNNE